MAEITLHHSLIVMCCIFGAFPCLPIRYVPSNDLRRVRWYVHLHQGKTITWRPNQLVAFMWRQYPWLSMIAHGWNRGSSPSQVTGKITDTKKAWRRPDPRLPKKTHGSRTDEREKSAEAFFGEREIRWSFFWRCQRLQRPPRKIFKHMLISHSLKHDKCSSWPYTITNPLGYCVGPFSIGFGQSLTPR